MSLRVGICGKPKPFKGRRRSESESEQGVLVAGAGPEAEVIYPWPG